MSQTTVNLTPEHRKLIDEKCLNLSRFVRAKLDEEFGKRNSVSMGNGENVSGRGHKETEAKDSDL